MSSVSHVVSINSVEPVDHPDNPIGPTISDVKTLLLRSWKDKCGVQSIMCYQSSVYFSFMDCFFGIPPIVMASVLVLLKQIYPMAELESVLQILIIIFNTVHVWCDFAVKSKNFKGWSDKWSAIRRDIDVFFTQPVTDTKLNDKIGEIKILVEQIKEGSETAPLCIYRKFDDTDEILRAIVVENQTD